jgi:hypothetical protein
MTDVWPWVALAGLGAFHGLNPAMGWLFSVALGLQHRSRSKILWSLVPIAAGHAISIAAVVILLILLGRIADLGPLRWIAAASLILFGVYRLTGRHKSRNTGMQVGFVDLTIWSFLMATSHGAGLMLLPVLVPMSRNSVHAGHMHGGTPTALTADLFGGSLVVAIHTLSMLAVAGLIAFLIYEYVGLAFLRRGWINLDLLWSIALCAAGIIMVVSAQS